MQFDARAYVVLGLDPSTKACGWAIGTMDGELQDSGAVIPDPNLEPHLRVFHVAQEIGKLYLKHQPHVIYMESPFAYKNPAGALLLAGLGAVINYVLWVASGRVTMANPVMPDEARSLIGVPPIVRLRDSEGKLLRDPEGKPYPIPKGETKKNALKWIRTLMDDMGLSYSEGKKIPVGEEDRIEAIGIYWAGCIEFSRSLEQASEVEGEV